MSTRLSIGISTCPNDTYAFHGLLSGAVRCEGLELDFELADVEELNRGLLAGRFDVAKVSLPVALARAADVCLLPVGAALGFGVGPVVIAGDAAPPAGPARVLAPGEHTTAALLWRLFHPEPARLRHVVFSDILPALARGEADLGVCIHEGRFTFEAHGLRLVEDLGETWEAASGAALPLGGIVARRELGPEVHARLSDGLRASIAHADAHPLEALETMRSHAREHDDGALWKHVELYVNAETRGLSQAGRHALAVLARRVREAQPGAAPHELELARFGEEL